jgi:hypothetical protein
VTGRLTAALTIAACALVPAAADAKRGSIFDMTKASGFERVTYKGDSAAGCEAVGTCGYEGTVTFRIGGKPKGALFLAKSRSGRFSGGASYRTDGVTTATVTGPATDPSCSDSVDHRNDVFSAKSLPSSPETLLFTYHSAAGDYLDTDCVGPTEKDLADAGALPEGAFPAKGFRRSRVGWQMSGSQPFNAGGFSAASEWSLTFRGKARECNPRCRIPAHRPR